MGVTIWVVDQVPESPFQPPAELAKIAIRGGNPEGLSVGDKEANPGRKEFNTLMDQISTNQVHRIDPTVKFCQTGRCIVSNHGHSLFRDGGHISTYGALWMADQLEPIFKSLSKR